MNNITQAIKARTGLGSRLDHEIYRKQSNSSFHSELCTCNADKAQQTFITCFSGLCPAQKLFFSPISVNSIVTD